MSHVLTVVRMTAKPDEPGNAGILSCNLQALVVRKVDNAIHWINHYPVDSVFVLSTLIRWIVIYPVDSIIHFSNNQGLAS